MRAVRSISSRTEELPRLCTNEEPYTAFWWKRVKSAHATVRGAMQDLDNVWID